MPKPPIKNNPAFLTDEELAGAFVARHDDLKLIVRVIRENTSDSNQHVLVIGPRGIGKTMLVLRVALEVRRDEELGQRWYPLVFAEESYEVGTVGEFWLESLFHLGRQTGDPMWARTYDDLKREPDEDRLRERALVQLMDFADSHSKRILLIVENLNMLLGGQLAEDHAWKLRGTLMHEPRLMLLATATARIDLPENTSKAMFEMFKPHVLPPLNDQECQAVWRSVAGQEMGTQRIRAIRILTGGNPRLLAIISHFGARLSFAELMREMTGLVDDHTEYFKSQLDALPPTERKVYVALADLWDPATAREVAAASRLGVSMTSSLLKRLVGRGAVSEVPGKIRTKRYQVAERMYNIYYLMRRRGAPSERVKAVVHFMVQFYEETELVEIARRLTEEARHLSGEGRQYHYYAFEGILRTAPAELRSKILQRTPWGFLEAADLPESLRRLLIEAGIGTDCPCDLQKHPDGRVASLMVKGRKAKRKDFLKDAEKAFREAIDIDATYPVAWFMLGSVLSKQPDRKGEAEQALRKAVEVAPHDPCAWDFLGHFLSKDPTRRTEAEQAFRKALEFYRDCSDAWLGLADLAGREPGNERAVAQAYRQAEEACERIIRKHPRNANHWRRLALIRHRCTKRYPEAEAAYRQVIELDPKDAYAHELLGTLLHYELEKHADAETVYRRAIELDPKSTSALGNLGRLLRDHLYKIEEAKELFERIVEAGSSDSHRAWVDIGLSCERLERYAEAETAYRKAVAIDPGFDLAWHFLGTLLHERLGRYGEAEAAYGKAIEHNPRHSCPRTRLVELMLAGLKQPDRALELAERSLAAMPDSASLLDGLSRAFLRFGAPRHLPLAEGWARKAVALEDVPARACTLACILAREGKTAEALPLTRKLLGNPKYVKAHIDAMVMLFTQLVAAGCAAEALRALRDSDSAAALEPVAVALQMRMGADVHVAPEIAEVAGDVLRRFQP